MIIWNLSFHNQRVYLFSCAEAGKYLIPADIKILAESITSKSWLFVKLIINDFKNF